MTEELKQAAQAALDQLEFLNACYPHKTATDAADALRRALTQRPAAQTDELPGMWDHSDIFGGETDAKPEWRDLFWALARELKCLPSTYPDANQHVFRAARALASLPAPQQATHEAAANERDCPHCNYTGSMHCGDVAEKYKADGDPKDCSHAKVYGLRAATPEPVGEAVANTFVQTVPDRCDRIIWRGQYIHLPITRPAPGVPEADPLQGAVDWFWQAIPNLKAHDVANRLSIGCNRAARLLAAAQAKGAHDE